MTRSEEMRLEIAGLREGLEIAREEIERLRKIEQAAFKVVAWLEKTEASRAYYKELAELLA